MFKILFVNSLTVFFKVISFLCVEFQFLRYLCACSKLIGAANLFHKRMPDEQNKNMGKNKKIKNNTYSKK